MDKNDVRNYGLIFAMCFNLLFGYIYGKMNIPITIWFYLITFLSYLIWVRILTQLFVHAEKKLVFCHCIFCLTIHEFRSDNVPHIFRCHKCGKETLILQTWDTYSDNEEYINNNPYKI